MEDLIGPIEQFKSLDIFNKDFFVSEKQTKLTSDEIQARNEWNKKRNTFVSACRKAKLDREIGEDNFQAFLSSFILPPRFGIITVSTRSKYNEPRKSKHYPHAIEAWPEFSGSIVGKDIKNTFIRKPGAYMLNPLESSAMYRIEVENDAHEEAFLHLFLWNPLSEAGLMLSRSDVAKMPGIDGSRISAVIGLPDYTGSGYTPGGGGRNTSMIECKSSHNLLVPNLLLGY
jgi:hypothetical protein